METASQAGICHSIHVLDRTGLRAGGCFTCANWWGEYRGIMPVCRQGGGRLVLGQPMLGCCYWMRTTGMDQEESRVTG